MNWLLLTILSIAFRATFGVAVKLLSNRAKVSAITQSVLLTGCAAILIIVFIPVYGGISFHGLSDHWLLAATMVLASAFGNILFFKGLEKLDASTTQIVFASILLWSVILSVSFLGSRFSINQIIGIGILVAAILLVQYRKGARIFDANALYILAAAVLFAVFQVTSAEMAKTFSVAAYSLTAYLGGTLVVGLIYFRQVIRDFAVLAKDVTRVALVTLFASSMSLLYAVFAYLAYQRAPDKGVVVVLLTSQVVFGVILAIIFLRERNNIPKKIAAGLLAVLAGVLIKS